MPQQPSLCWEKHTKSTKRFIGTPASTPGSIYGQVSSATVRNGANMQGMRPQMFGNMQYMAGQMPNGMPFSTIGANNAWAPANMPNMAWQQQQQMAMQQQMVMQQQQQAMQMQAMRMQAMQQQQQQQQQQMRAPSQPPPQQHQQQQQQQHQQQQQQQQIQSPGAGKQYNFPGARKRPAPADFGSSSGKPMSNKAAKRAAATAPLVPMSGPVSVRPAANAEEAAEIEAWKAERRKHWPSAANTSKKAETSAQIAASGALDGSKPAGGRSSNRAALAAVLQKQRALGLAKAAGTADLVINGDGSIADNGEGFSAGGRGFGRGGFRGRGRDSGFKGGGRFGDGGRGFGRGGRGFRGRGGYGSAYGRGDGANSAAAAAADEEGAGADAAAGGEAGAQQQQWQGGWGGGRGAFRGCRGRGRYNSGRGGYSHQQYGQHGQYSGTGRGHQDGWGPSGGPAAAAGAVRSFLRRRKPLLEALLSTDMRREASWLLQATRFLVMNNFLQPQPPPVAAAAANADGAAEPPAPVVAGAVGSAQGASQDSAMVDDGQQQQHQQGEGEGVMGASAAAAGLTATPEGPVAQAAAAAAPAAAAGVTGPHGLKLVFPDEVLLLQQQQQPLAAALAAAAAEAADADKELDDGEGFEEAAQGLKAAAAAAAAAAGMASVAEDADMQDAEAEAAVGDRHDLDGLLDFDGAELEGSDEQQHGMSATAAAAVHTASGSRDDSSSSSGSDDCADSGSDAEPDRSGVDAVADLGQEGLPEAGAGCGLQADDAVGRAAVPAAAAAAAVGDEDVDEDALLGALISDDE